MPRRKTRSLVRGAVLAVMLAWPTALPGQTSVSLGSWHAFEWFSGAGSFIDDPFGGFFLQAVQRVRVRVTDLFYSGDVFSVFVNGSLLASTSSVAPDVDTGIGDGDAAWASAQLSKAEFFLDPGEYQIDLFVSETAPGFDYGEGALRADLADETVTPEPFSMALLGTGLAGIGAAARRRRRQ